MQKPDARWWERDWQIELSIIQYVMMKISLGFDFLFHYYFLWRLKARRLYAMPSLRESIQMYIGNANGIVMKRWEIREQGAKF